MKSHNPRFTHLNTPPIWVNTSGGLADLVKRLNQESIIAVDTESDSMYVYFEKVCLIQFSVPGADYLLDPLALPDLSSLAPIFADPAVEKVFHAAEYDVMVLRRDHGFEFANIFDTMIASRMLGWPHYGLGSILDEHFDVKQNKKMQRHNWGRRPLSTDEKKYARLDTHYLLPLREILMAELQESGLLAETREMFDEVATAVWQGGQFDPNGFWLIRGTRELDPGELAVLRELYLFREREAQRRNRPPFKILTKSTMLRLAQSKPHNRKELERVTGISPYLLGRYGRRLLKIIEQGRQAEPPSRPKNNHRRPDPQITARYEALRAWRKKRAAPRGIEPDVILSNAVLRILAHRRPRTPQELAELDILGPVKRKKYGQEVLQILNKGGKR